MADQEAPLLGRRRLPIYQKFSYSVGHVLNDLTASMWFTYMIIYFHQVKNFDNSLAGDLVLIGQVSDAIFTPFIGYESDRVKGCFKMGKRKTWHFIGTVCVMLSFPFLFVDCITCSHAPDLSQFVYYAPFVIIFQFGWASTQINHLSLIPDLTDDTDERVGLNGSRYAFTVLSNIIVYAIAWLIFSLGKTATDTSQLTFEDAGKFRLLVLVVVGIGIIFSLLFHVGVREKAHPRSVSSVTESSIMNTVEKSTMARLKMTWKCWLKESQFYQIAVIYMSTRLVVNITQVYLPMYITETIDLDKETIAIIPLIVYVSGFATSLLMKYVNQAAGRKVTYLIGLVFTVGACVFFYFLAEKSKLVYAAAVLSGVGGSTMLVTSLAMTADLINCNTESGAFVYGAMSFTDKLSNGAAIAIIQKFHPCPIGCCPACSMYYRKIVSFVPGAMAIVAVVALATLIPVTLGTRRKKVQVLRPVNSQARNEEVDEISYDSDDERDGLLSGEKQKVEVTETINGTNYGTYSCQENESMDKIDSCIGGINNSEHLMESEVANTNTGPGDCENLCNTEVDNKLICPGVSEIVSASIITNRNIGPDDSANMCNSEVISQGPADSESVRECVIRNSRSGDSENTCESAATHVHSPGSLLTRNGTCLTHRNGSVNGICAAQEGRDDNEYVCRSIETINSSQDSTVYSTAIQV